MPVSRRADPTPRSFGSKVLLVNTHKFKDFHVAPAASSAERRPRRALRPAERERTLGTLGAWWVMPVRLRLQRWGRIHKPFYRIVACDRKAPRDGKFLDRLGTYNPLPDQDGNKHVTLNVERIYHWLALGARPTETVGRILSRAALIPPWPRRGAIGPAAATAARAQQSVPSRDGALSDAPNERDASQPT